MIATTIGGNTIGIRKTVRTARISPLRRLSSKAKPTPMRSCKDTVQNDSFAWTHNELRKRASVGNSAKLANGCRKSHSVAGLVRLSGVKLVASRYAIGSSVTTISTARDGARQN